MEKRKFTSTSNFIIDVLLGKDAWRDEVVGRKAHALYVKYYSSSRKGTKKLDHQRHRDTVLVVRIPTGCHLFLKSPMCTVLQYVTMIFSVNNFFG